MMEDVTKALYCTVLSYTENNKVSWVSVQDEMFGMFGIDLTPDQWRTKYRSITGASNKARSEKRRNVRDAKTVSEINTNKQPEKIEVMQSDAKTVSEISTSQNTSEKCDETHTNMAEKVETNSEQLLAVLKNKRTPQQDADLLHVSLEAFNSGISNLKLQGFNISESNHLIWLEKSAVSTNLTIIEPYKNETQIIIGVVSDTHLCNKFQQLTYLNEFYDKCEFEGIKTIYHSGDISDGYYKNRPEHIYELFKIGLDEQAEYIIENYPRRKNIVTKFITGNHDATHVKNGGSDIGKRISEKREDMQYLGYMKAKVWLTPQCDMDLFHPLDGNSYALSYQLQKHIDGLQGGSKPRILICGHYHKSFYMPYRNINALAAPCFEAQTNFELGKHLNAVVGGYIVKISCTSDGCITEFSPTMVQYYDMIINDWRT
jgi:predicted phosphodiesterase